LKQFRILILSAAVGLFSTASHGQHLQKPAAVPDISKLPFTPGLKLGDTLYVSGHLGVDPSSSTASDDERYIDPRHSFEEENPQESGTRADDAKDEARRVLESVKQTLHEAGMTMDDLVYVEVFCTDLKMYGAFNDAYASFFQKPYPARDFIGVKDLLFGAHFEVMGIAVRNAAQAKRQPVDTK
jgi:2-iminobutanoate/2-iminopropanoate deaminase